ncbi:DUF6215 domain-containing protein [Streptomyces sp. NPDC048603]|uniref:DUF6215 domain-containing protein n=1 Tax=Streptomyces sp. NPDC048603 TaxID=3365577 RepID=UPI0037200304
MADRVAVANEGMSAPAQVIAAVVLVGGLAAGAWSMQAADQKEADGPAKCSVSTDVLPAQYASGAQLCAALNRPDLPTLLGAPEDRVRSASGTGDWQTFGSAKKMAAPEATVETEKHHVEIGVDYELRVESAALLGSDVQKQTVLGRPAVFYSSRTLAIGFNLGGSGKATSGQGPMARSLAVARDAKDGGGFYEVIIWRQSGSLMPDDTTLLSVAEKVLPTLPGWQNG